MGVVRREGEWRLEKREEGLYEVTFRREPQAKVVTPDYTQGMIDDISLGMVPVHEVDSYAEAEGLFEERAHGGPPAGMAPVGGRNSSHIDADAAEVDLGLDFGGGDREAFEDVEKLPPGGFALVFLLVGGVVLSISGFAPGEPMFLVGAGMAIIGAAIVGWAVVLFRTQGWSEALEFLVTVEDQGETSSPTGTASDGSGGSVKTPVPPEKLKRELIFGRAEQECEWCGDHLDNPHVHHIEPRREGGPNEHKNLIVLCPTCHEKADRGGITRTKLRQKMRHMTR